MIIWFCNMRTIILLILSISSVVVQQWSCSASRLYVSTLWHLGPLLMRFIDLDTPGRSSKSVIKKLLCLILVFYYTQKVVQYDLTLYSALEIVYNCLLKPYSLDSQLSSLLEIRKT